MIKTILSQSNQEIGQFLHLPEMDPMIVRTYDREIVTTCIEKYIEDAIRTFNITLIEKILGEMKIKVSPLKVAELNKKLNRLRDLIMRLLERLPENPEQIEKDWARIQREHQAIIDEIEQRFNLPTWAKVCLCIPIGIPYGIFQLLKWNAQNKATQQALENTIDQCCQEVDQTYDILLRLKDIEKIIKKQDAIDTAFNSVQISTQSLRDLSVSIRDRINRVRAVYGNEEWDTRVSFLADKFLLANFRPTMKTHIACIFAYAYLLIEPGLSLCERGDDKSFGILIEATLQGEKNPSGPIAAAIVELYNNVKRNYMDFLLTTSPHQQRISLSHRRIEIRDAGRGPTLAEEISKLHEKNFPLNRTLSAAAILKAYENEI
ncbi:MAG: hypothetical protein ACRDFB_01410 [Rhabdochlamydiaceae bacterium]